MNLKKVIVFASLTITLLLGIAILTLEYSPEVVKNQKDVVFIYSSFKNAPFFEILKKDFCLTYRCGQKRELELLKNQAVSENSKILKNSELYNLVKNDFANLKATSDKRLFTTKSINWQIRDVDFEKIQLEKAIGLSVDLNSNIALEVEVFSQTDQSEKLTIVQLSYTDLLSGNKIHEFSRMYQQDKKKPD